MGMDVTGKSGNYFRANIWSWRPIHALCEELNEQYHLGLDFTGWEHNDGRGLNTQRECNALADAIEREVKQSGKKEWILEDSRIRVDEKGQFLPMGATGGKSPYSTDDDHLLEFVKFLRECGGSFEIF